jgi:hypothetical protein
MSWSECPNFVRVGGRIATGCGNANAQLERHGRVSIYNAVSHIYAYR